MDYIAIDFETHRIAPRPHYPPRAVGVAIKYRGEAGRYYAFGHASANNCDLDEAASALERAYGTGAPLLFHNAKFDLAVLEEGFGAPSLPWERVHDTMFLLFLADPHSKALALKSAAEEILGWAPEERDAVAEWVWENRKRLAEADPAGPGISREKGIAIATPKSVGEWLAYAPGDVVAPYAIGDVERTAALFEHLYPIVQEAGMGPAYDRERRILPIFMENERLGIRVDSDALERDLTTCRLDGDLAEEWLRKRLRAPGLNLDADQDVAEALASAGIIAEDSWTLTKTGKRSVSKKNLTPAMYLDPEVANTFGYRNRLQTATKMFMEPWLAQSREFGGRISTNWNQTRGSDGGTRTGRPSTNSPNLLNISKSFEGRTDGYAHPTHLAVAPLPLVRNYVLADEGHAFLHRDFDGQELRVFAHFESGDLFNAYLADPALDPHAMIGDRVNEITGTQFERTVVKNINFGKLYGAGIPRIMEVMQCGRAEAKRLSDIHAQAMPGIRALQEEITRVVKGGDPIRTWGGRVYFPEEPRLIEGRMVDFIYKLLNYLVQGSAADITKEAIIQWHGHPKRDKDARLLATVYDEVNLSAPREIMLPQMAVLREVMEQAWLDVPMLSSPKVGLSWGGCKKPAKGEVEPVFMARMARELT